MRRGRVRFVPGYWLKAFGHARGPLAEDWIDSRAELLRRTGFPRRPRIAEGDRLVLYASVWRRVFAICEATGAPVERDHPRWPWTVAIETLLLVPVLDAAPPVEAMGVAPRSMSQQSHIRIGPEHFDLAVDAISGVAGRADRAAPGHAAGAQAGGSYSARSSTSR